MKVGLLTTAPLIGAWTKSDLRDSSVPADDFPGPVVRVRARSGEGIGELLQEVTQGVGGVVGDTDRSTPLVTRARHRKAMESARNELGAFHAAWVHESLPAPVACAHVKQAIRSLDELVGAVDVDEILARVFSTFCVGK
jgi:tRNA modification GTPase